ncbi:MAG: hypothetical protein ABFD18_06065 [Syntrophomonas sp.]
MSNLHKNSIENEKLSKADIERLRSSLTKHDLEEFFNIASVAGTYELATEGVPDVLEGTHQFVRDVQIAQLLHDKFPNMPYDSTEGFKSWLAERSALSIQAKANALSRLQGDGAGEVDFIREMQGRLQNLFTKTEFATNSNGQISSNIAGIDVVEKSRITGKIINEYQIKTLRTPESINQTLKGFVDNKQYNPNITLVGPKELIDEAKAQELPNPTKVMGTIQENAKSAKTLEDKVSSGNMVTAITPTAVAEKVIGGAVIGAVISVGISSLFSYIDYKNGKITKKEMFTKIGKDTAKGGIAGGTMAGLSLFIPGGIIGFGVAMIVGTALRRALDDAFGMGMFAEVLDLTHSVQANVKNLSYGSMYIADLVETNGHLMVRSLSVVDEMRNDRFRAYETYENIERKYHQGQFISNGKSALEILDQLDNERYK